MIDFHNHILPCIDDGSKSIEMSLSMLNTALNQGITDVVNTVHFQHPKVEGKKIIYDNINKEIIKLQNELDRNAINIKIHIGAEVFYLPNLLDIKDDPLTTFGNGKYMLIEFSPNFIPNNELNDLFNLKMSGITPIIAHPERYFIFQDDYNLIYDYLSAGCLMQVDAGSILGFMGENALKTALAIIKNEWCSILGSDAHDNNRRNFCLNDAYKIVKKLLGDEATQLIKENPYKVINGQPIISNFRQSEKKKSFIFHNLFKRIKS